ncbi:MAG: hypothetical protein ACRDB1_08460 [Microcoleaceae cyanobacterium]
MLTYHRLPVSLSIISTDLPIFSIIETAATIYQKENNRLHILLNEPSISEGTQRDKLERDNLEKKLSDKMAQNYPIARPRLLWLEVSHQRVVMTMQSHQQFNYRHLWEKGTSGMSRYWLQSNQIGLHQQLRLKNFTHNLVISGQPIPKHLRLEYELWSGKLSFGHYLLDLEIYS